MLLLLISFHLVEQKEEEVEEDDIEMKEAEEDNDRDIEEDDNENEGEIKPKNALKVNERKQITGNSGTYEIFNNAGVRRITIYLSVYPFPCFPF